MCREYTRGEQKVLIEIVTERCRLIDLLVDGKKLLKFISKDVRTGLI
jgi:hypothetical protein